MDVGSGRVVFRSLHSVNTTTTILHIPILHSNTHCTGEPHLCYMIVTLRTRLGIEGWHQTPEHHITSTLPHCHTIRHSFVPAKSSYLMRPALHHLPTFLFLLFILTSIFLTIHILIKKYLTDITPEYFELNCICRRTYSTVFPLLREEANTTRPLPFCCSSVSAHFNLNERSELKANSSSLDASHIFYAPIARSYSVTA
jgi:hypothetical protein